MCIRDRTRETLVIHDACSDQNWQSNLYIANNRIRSVLCMPVVYQNRLKGVVYLENNLSDNVFTSERLEIPVSYTHLRAHETVLDLVCRLLLEKKKKTKNKYDHKIKPCE